MKPFIISALLFFSVLSTPAHTSPDIDLEVFGRAMTRAAVCQATLEVANHPTEATAFKLISNEMIAGIVPPNDPGSAVGMMLGYNEVKQWTLNQIRSGKIPTEDVLPMVAACLRLLVELNQIAINSNQPTFTERAQNENQ